MSVPHITIPVAKGVEDLIPAFMKNRTDEIETLRDALAAGDYAQLGRLGHRMTGVGEPYGFAMVSAIGRQIEDGARAGDRDALARHLAEYADYLARIRIVYK